MMKIGWIGTGIMGGPMAGHLQAAGHDLYIFNRTRGKAESLLNNGAHWCESPVEVAANSEIVFTMVAFAWCGLGSAFGPALLLTLWWRKTTREGVLAGMVVGTLVTIIWHFTPTLNDMIKERTPAFIMALIAVWSVSLATNKKNNISSPYKI